jgi:bifunctional DNA-binding transcriptional regulator/antitoxin component of YhaV-PrlF toxin-antitoxin module
MVGSRNLIYSKVYGHGTVHLPREIRLALGVKDGDVLLYAEMGLGKVVMMKGEVKEESS